MGDIMNELQLVIFDLDGVITETSNQHYTAWKQLAGELGIEIDLAFNETLKGVSRMDSLERILTRGNRQNDYTEAEKIELATKKNSSYVNMISKFTRDNVFPGIVELLNNLKAQGIKIALGSASKNGPRLLNSMDITNYFDYIVNPALVNGKPNPDIFLKAADMLMVDPSKCIGIEDAVSGITAINAAGMFSVGIGDKTILSKANIVYNEPKDIDLEEIKNLIQKRKKDD